MRLCKAGKPLLPALEFSLRAKDCVDIVSKKNRLPERLGGEDFPACGVDQLLVDLGPSALSKPLSAFLRRMRSQIFRKRLLLEAAGTMDMPMCASVAQTSLGLR